MSSEPMKHARRKQCVSVAAAILVAGVFLAAPVHADAQLKVIVSGGFRGAYETLLPEFERATGIQVTTTSGASIGNGPTTIPSQIRHGVAADVVILAREGLDGLIAEKRIVAGSDVDLARSLIGMIVRAGMPTPDISTVERFKQALLQAQSIAVSTSASGVYLTTTLFPRLGIAEAVARKVIASDAGAQEVSSGRAELGLQQVSEVLRVSESQFVGTIPAELQRITVFSAAIVGGSSHVAESRRLIAFLSSANAAAAIRRSGMEPLPR